MMRNPKAQSNSLSQIFLGKEENNLKELDLIEIQKESWEKLLDKEVLDGHEIDVIIKECASEEETPM